MTDGDEFFVGWSSHISSSLARFLGATAAMIVAVFAALGALLAVSITDPARSLLGSNGAPGDWREVTLEGVLTSAPYPFLSMAPDAVHPYGHGVLLSGDGKRAAAYDRVLLEGRSVSAKGLLLKRGTLDMLVVTEPPRALADARPARTSSTPLGSWRVVGEICDGKCGAGIMSPGTGIAHKACASLCVIGGVPPVLVLAQPLADHQFLMISDEHGQSLEATLPSFIGMRVEIEGEVELRGDVALIKIAAGRLRRL